MARNYCTSTCEVYCSLNNQEPTIKYKISIHKFILNKYMYILRTYSSLANTEKRKLQKFPKKHLDQLLATHRTGDLILAKSKNGFLTTKLLCPEISDTITLGEKYLLCVHPRYSSTKQLSP